MIRATLNSSRLLVSNLSEFRSCVRSFSSSASISNNQPLSNNDYNNLKENHLNLLKKYYSSDLIESIKLAETSIDPAHWDARKPSAKFAPPYLDDFSKIDPFWDNAKQPQADFMNPSTTLARPDVPEGATVVESVSGRGNESFFTNLSKLTGLSKNYISGLKTRPLVVKMVSNQTRKGKIPSFYALVVCGDGNGMVGLGEGKDRQGLAGAITKANWNAIKNLQHIPRLEDRTIVGDIDFRYHGVKLFLRSAPPGFGLRVNHYIFEICECAGIKDLSGKVYKSRNGMNIAKGTVEALTQGRSLEELALGRGKKVIDLRKTYYSP